MSLLLAAVWIALFGFLLLTVAATVLRLRRPVPASGGDLPRCSIIVPLKGASNFLESNISALARLDPFAGEVLLAVARADDPAVAIVAPIVARHADRMRFLIGEVPEFANPKLRNVAKAYRESREDVILFLDDSVELSPAMFAELVGGLKPGVAGVSAAPWGGDAESFPAEIEAASCNGYLFRIEMLLDLFDAAAAFGNAFAFRRRDLEAAGGFGRLAEGPCEDNALSKALRARGRLKLVRYGIRRRIGRRSWRDIYARHLRWKNCVKSHDPVAFLFEPAIGGLAFVVLGAFVLASLAGISHWAGLGASLAVWYGCEALLHMACGWRITPVSPLAWLVRDLAQPVLTVLVLFTREVQWRGEAFPLRQSSGPGAPRGG